MKTEHGWAIVRHGISILIVGATVIFGYGVLHGQVSSNDDQISDNTKKIEAIEDKIQKLSNQQGVLIHQQRANEQRDKERHGDIVKRLDRLTDVLTPMRRSYPNE